MVSICILCDSWVYCLYIILQNSHIYIMINPIIVGAPQIQLAFHRFTVACPHTIVELEFAVCLVFSSLINLNVVSVLVLAK